MSDLAPERNLVNLLETQFGAAGTDDLAQTLGANSNLIATFQNTPIGSIVESLLTQSQFQTAIGNANWLLCNGQTCGGSAYATLTGNTTVPDFRATVLRGKNNGRSDGNQNQNGDLALGTLTVNQIANHTHSTTLSHDIVGGTTSKTQHSGAQNFVGEPESAAPNSYLGFNLTGPVDLPANSDGDENPTALSEVRVRAIVVNYFMRVS